MAEKETFKLVQAGPTISKTDSLQVQINLVSINGKEMLDIRQYYVDKESGEWKPTPKGVPIPKDKLNKFMRRLTRFVEQLELD